MNGRRARRGEVSSLRAKCIKLRNEKKTYREIGFILGLHRTTVMWHLGKIKKEKFIGAAARQKERRLKIKTGKIVPGKKYFIKKWESLSCEDKRRFLVTDPAILGTKGRVKSTEDGKYHYWCDFCLGKTLWDDYIKTGYCSICKKSPSR